MNKRQNKMRFCDGSVQPDVLLDPGTRSAWPGWSSEHRLFAELVRTGQTQQLSEAHSRPPQGKEQEMQQISSMKRNVSWCYPPVTGEVHLGSQS